MILGNVSLSKGKQGLRELLDMQLFLIISWCYLLAAISATGGNLGRGNILVITGGLSQYLFFNLE